MKLILANGTEIGIDSFALPLMVRTECASVAAACSLWQEFTPSAMQSMVVKDGETVVQVIAGARLANAQMVMNGGGTVSAHFWFDGVTADQAAEELPGEGEITAEEALTRLTGGAF